MPTRRTVLGAVGAGTGAVAGCLGTIGGESCPEGSLGSVSGEWSTRGGGAGHAGATDAGGFASAPETRWCAELEGRLTSLLLSGGTLYAVERVGGMGDRTFHLQARDAADGSREWRRRLPAEVIAEAAVADGGVHLTMQGEETDLVARYATAGGSEDWVVEFTDGTDSMPAVADGTVYVVDAAGEVYAYEAASGAERWATTVSNRIDPALRGNVPAVVDGTVYVGTAIGKGPAALSAADGSLLWQRDLPDFFHPVTDGSVLLGTGDATMYGLDPSTGDTRWRIEPAELGGSARPTLAGDTVYALPGGDVAAYDAADGSQRWVRSPPDAIGAPGHVVATDGTLLVAGREGVGGVDPADGSGLWTAEFEVDRFVVGDGAAFASTVGGELRGLGA